ncbi:hypothetical protein HGRIS_009074 [Hohenbuehelia grisea]|uniref:DUF6535 domain-containing protein n=1 Tax=Hohenbuehelia grisea TaxID=104357 RepID=A0ABR3J070_9AGAR
MIPHSDTTFGPSRSDVWVNGLWFISLTLSLSTALLAVLFRQLLHQYTAIAYGTSRERSHIRQLRYDGLMKWRVPIVISLLPILLQVALGLFLVGLVVFLLPLSMRIGWAVASITLIVSTIYTISHILPLVDSQCPYETPFSAAVRGIISSFRNPAKETLQKGIHADEATARAITWLLKSASNPPTTSIALQSLGAFPLEMSQKLPPDTKIAIDTAIQQIIGANDPQNIPSESRRLERLLRSISLVYPDYDISHNRAALQEEPWRTSILPNIPLDNVQIQVEPSVGRSLGALTAEQPPLASPGLQRSAVPPAGEPPIVEQFSSPASVLGSVKGSFGRPHKKFTGVSATVLEEGKGKMIMETHNA